MSRQKNKIADLTIPKPEIKPERPFFSSGPCAKRPGWSLEKLKTPAAGRSHRSKIAIKRLNKLTDLIRQTLGVPDDYKIGIAPASDSGAFEMALWNLLGVPGQGVDIFAWEHFSRIWRHDIVEQLSIKDHRIFEVPCGEWPDMNRGDPDRDWVFAWNGTTAGVAVPEHFQFPRTGKGLRICDATSAVFAYDLPFADLDVITWSLQKSIGGEAQHGVIIMSPKALKRLAEQRPAHPIPSIFDLRYPYGTVNESFFDGITLNTPSMLCVEDGIDALEWVRQIGGRRATQARVQKNYDLLSDWVESRPWIEFLPDDPLIRSMTSPCLKIVDPRYTALGSIEKENFMIMIWDQLEDASVGFDLRSYKTSPLGIRIWCGATVEASDLKALLPWLEWVFHETLTSYPSLLRVK